MSKLNELSSQPVGRLLWKYSLPAVVGMVVMSLYNVIDRIFIGQVFGPEAISGLTITFPVMNITTAIGVLVGAGASARISIAMGEGNHRLSEMILGNAITLTFINAAVYITVFAIFIDPILRLFGASDVTIPYAREFIIYLLPGLLMTNIAFGLNNIMRASGYPGRAMFTMIIGAGCNVILAPIFLFVLRTGIRGAAIATDISMAVSAAFVLAHFFNRNSHLHFTKGTFALRRHIIIAIISIGAAPALVNFAACGINALINTTLYNFGGDIAVGAAGIFTTYAALLTTVILGVCQGMQPIVGYNYGAGCYGRLRRTYLLAVAVATAICTLGSVVGLAFPHAVASAFTTDPRLIDTTVRALSLTMLAFPVVGFQIISTTFFQSIGQAGKSIFLSLTRQVLFLIPLLLILPRYMRLEGVWISFPTADIIATVVTALLIILQFRQINALSRRSDRP